MFGCSPMVIEPGPATWKMDLGPDRLPCLETGRTDDSKLDGRRSEARILDCELIKIRSDVHWMLPVYRLGVPSRSVKVVKTLYCNHQERPIITNVYVRALESMKDWGWLVHSSSFPTPDVSNQLGNEAEVVLCCAGDRCGPRALILARTNGKLTGRTPDHTINDDRLQTPNTIHTWTRLCHEGLARGTTSVREGQWTAGQERKTDLRGNGWTQMWPPPDSRNGVGTSKLAKQSGLHSWRSIQGPPPPGSSSPALTLSPLLHAASRCVWPRVAPFKPPSWFDNGFTCWMIGGPPCQMHGEASQNEGYTPQVQPERLEALCSKRGAFFL